LDSKKVRQVVFEQGFVLNKRERDAIILKVANQLGVSRNEVESAIFADMPKEQVLNISELPEPEDLIREYNLSITQTLLFNALELTFTVGSNYQTIFKTINYLGLMYETDGMEIKITGPVSLLKKTRKYGTSLAKLVPFIITSDKWEIEAKIEMVRGNEPRIFTFKMKSTDKILLPHNNFNAIEFDSDVEKQLYNDLKLYAPDWKTKREPTFIKAGNYVIIPDFGFFKNNTKLYLEVVGFWTPEYIQKKIQKFNQTDTKIIIAVNQNLKCSRNDFPGEVIFYKKKIPIKPILKILRREEEKQIQKELIELSSIELSEPIVDLISKAEELNINPHTLERIKIPNYFIVGKKIISQDFLNKLKKKIENKHSFAEIKLILDDYQLTTKLLDLIGFEVIWKGLIPIKVVRKHKQKNIQ